MESDEEPLPKLQQSLAARIARIQEATKSRSAPQTERVTTPVAEAHASLCSAGTALAQQARTFFILMQHAPSASDIEGCAREFTSAIDMYDSWAGALLSIVLPAVRKSIGAPLNLVLQTTAGFVGKFVQGTGAVASDAGMIQEAVDALPKLETSAITATVRMLQQSGRLVADALRELKESIAEASGDGTEEEDDAMDEDEDESELLASAAVAEPLVRLVAAGGTSLDVAANDALGGGADAGDGAAGPDAAVLTMITTCAQAAATCVDSTVASAMEDDEAGLAAQAASLGKVCFSLLLNLLPAVTRFCRVTMCSCSRWRRAHVRLFARPFAGASQAAQCPRAALWPRRARATCRM